MRAKADILLVDDRPGNLVALQAILEPLGQNLVTASSGEEALRHLLTREFAVILLDVQMPGIDGFETAAAIKQREKTRHIPIIFLTAIDKEPGHTLRGYSAGAVDYLFKPFDPLVLRSKVAVFIDLYHLKREAQELAHRALHDPLTALPNRTLFHDRLEMALARMKRGSTGTAVLFVDLNGFKAINDGLGHKAGDELLVQVAGRLHENMRATDSVARYGGDEFTILSEGIVDERDVIEIARRTAESIATPFALKTGEVTLTASVGIAMASGPEQDPEALIREADAAMYRAKQAGGSRHEVYDQAMRTRTRERVRTENALRRAFERGELRVHYQPQFRLETGAAVGVEALVRWEHPERGLLHPAEFLPVAEESSLIVPIGTWVLEEALRQAERWALAGEGAEGLAMAVNISARELWSGGVVGAVARALAATHTDPASLCLEFSEHSIGDGRMSKALSELKELGVRLAIDDFGTGQASITSLQRLPIDQIKLDPSFVAALERDGAEAALPRTVVQLAHSLGIAVTAEGVETDEQAAALLRVGCDIAQGAHFAPPGEATTVEQLVAAPAQSLAAASGA